jgi:hypothetical protein
MTVRETPQPEAFFLDAERCLSLVIERKSLHWPSDYPHRHKNDHLIAKIFSERLRDLCADALYELRLPMLIPGKEKELLRSVEMAIAAG